MQRLHDVGVLKLRKETGFAKESLSPCCFGLAIGIEYLDRGGLLGVRVESLEYRGHSACVDTMLDLPTRKQDTIFP